VQRYCNPSSDLPQPDTKAVVQHFGPVSVTNVPVYTAFYIAREWSHKPLQTELLELAVANVRLIKHPVVRNAIICCLFEKVFGSRISSIIELVDKARRVPRDNICVRMCGLDIKSSVVFFEKCLELLGEDYLILDDMYTKADDIISDITAELHIPPLRGAKEYANDVFGTMISCFKDSTANTTTNERFIASNLIVRHQAMLKTLKAIYTYDIKMVRPSRLFPSSTKFGQSFVVSNDMEEEDPQETAEIQKERALFLEKLPSGVSLNNMASNATATTTSVTATAENEDGNTI
jgi:hypothetical protein